MGALGSDTGGSIRIPSSFCGVVGFKPTYGRVSLRGVIPLSWNLDHAGPMGRCVKDVSILLQAIAGYDPQDAWSINMPVDDYGATPLSDLRNWRIAVAADDHFTDSDVVDKDVLQEVRRAALEFETLGAQVVQVDFPNAWDAAMANGLMTTSDAAAFHHQRLSENPQGFGRDVLKRLQTGAAYTSIEYSLARRMQTILRCQFNEFFNEFDLLLTPTTPITASSCGSTDAVDCARLLTRFTAPFNLTGLPALSVPCGWSGLGMPIGLQIVGKSWTESKVLGAGALYEQRRGFQIPITSLP
jgi:aspartyl-tRNA(Asn)/glutamyl-tRNA(Gln) amidotransferase subunit A